MADTKISALTAATTPLAGTEVFPIVQSSTTKKVAIADVTAGRNVSMTGATLTATTTATIYTDSVDGTDNKRIVMAGTGTAGTNRGSYQVLYGNEYSGSEGNIDFVAGVPSIVGSGVIRFLTAGAEAFRIDENKNLVVGTAGKGIDFSITSSGSGTMTSELLADYEEGDWTPNQGGGLTVIGTFSSSGKYTKIGRQVTISGIVSGSTSVSVVAAGLICTNTPFTSIPPYGNGSASNQNNDVSITVLQAGTSVYANGTVAATANIYFTVTYFV